MGATVVVNPDKFHAQRAAGLRPARLSPVTYRKKLRDAGLNQNLARAAKPNFRLPAMNFNLLAKISSQQRWTRMLIEIVSRKP